MLGLRYSECRLSGWRFSGDSKIAQRQRAVIGKLAELATDMSHGGRVPQLLWLGPPGTGKDHMASALIRSVLASGRSAMIKTGADLWSATRDVISREITEQDALQQYVSPTVLCISDPIPPGTRLTEFQAAWLYRIVDNRYRKSRPTWATINASDQNEIASRITPQVWDRLRDGAAIVDCNWPSYRKPTEVI